MQRDFRNKTVVVTGAGGGLGAAYARRFGQAGARIAMLDINGPAVAAAAEALRAEGIDALAIPCDVADAAGVVAAFEQVLQHLGDIDVLINNAGISARAPFAETRLEVFHRVMAVNFFGALYCTRAALGSLTRRKGLIITISSLAGFTPLLGRTAYSASKHALHGLFDSLRSEVRGSGVGVLIACPGFTATGIATAALSGDGSINPRARVTVGRPASPEQVAERVFQAARKNKRLLVLSPAGHIGRIVNKLSPALYAWLMTRAVKNEFEKR